MSNEPIARVGLKHLLSTAPGFTIIGETGTAEAMWQSKTAKPDVMLIHAADCDFAQTIDLVRHSSHQARTVLIGRDIQGHCLAALFAAGVLGYVQFQAGPVELFGAIRAAARGQKFIDPRLSDEIFELLVNHSAGAAKRLSSRERQVLRMLAFGHTMKEIANQLRVGQKSVQTYRSRIREKLGLRTRADIVRYALDAGILSAISEKAS